LSIRRKGERGRKMRLKLRKYMGRYKRKRREERGERREERGERREERGERREERHDCIRRAIKKRKNIYCLQVRSLS
jgi:hypothetical protein